MVKIAGFTFNPTTISVGKGTDVTWVNEDPAEHTVTAKDNLFASSPLPSGSTFVAHFDRVGTFDYFCAIHPTIQAKVHVVD